MSRFYFLFLFSGFDEVFAFIVAAAVVVIVVAAEEWRHLELDKDSSLGNFHFHYFNAFLLDCPCLRYDMSLQAALRKTVTEFKNSI